MAKFVPKTKGGSFAPPASSAMPDKPFTKRRGDAPQDEDDVDDQKNVIKTYLNGEAPVPKRKKKPAYQGLF